MEYKYIGNMKVCNTCGKELAKNADICPNCGAKQKKKHTVLGIVLIIFGVLLFVSGISGFFEESESPKAVESSIPSSDIQVSVESPKLQEKDKFGVGETAELNDVIVTLNSVTENTGSTYMKPSAGNVFLLCEFTIENNSSKDLAVSSLLSFEAYVDDFSTSMNLSATTSSDKNQLDGSIAATKKMNGVIGYEVPIDWENFEIRFTPNVWNGKEIIFVSEK